MNKIDIVSHISVNRNVMMTILNQSYIDRFMMILKAFHLRDYSNETQTSNI